ncbi:hypothetical protein NDU88_011287 [Pleurodeles waltl]|uniref:Uncharacterized protein n=1 Tax=Pleurodeles waltl TaxID=8319 RepID=A0AAV7R2Y1_PLEWA|nr:hypothetical protein NDU88_011287 [Pleurodeles waltl]
MLGDEGWQWKPKDIRSCGLLPILRMSRKMPEDEGWPRFDTKMQVGARFISAMIRAAAKTNCKIPDLFIKILHVRRRREAVYPRSHRQGVAEPVLKPNRRSSPCPRSYKGGLVRARLRLPVYAEKRPAQYFCENKTTKIEPVIKYFLAEGAAPGPCTFER